MIEKLSDIQKNCYEESKRAGYVDLWNKPNNTMEEAECEFREEECKFTEQDQKVFDIAELGLIPSEVAEAQEEVRNLETNQDHLAEECADILIRTLNFMSRKGIDATEAIAKKHEKNCKRSTLHGRAV